MPKIVVTEFITLDGIIEAPNEWSMPYWNDDIGAFKHEELFDADAQLLGRVTYDGFAAAWPNMTEETGDFGERMNGMPKYVVSKTLEKAEWNNSTIVRDLDEVAKLDGTLLVAGSSTLIQSLIARDLVDEYRLLVYPVVLGKGKRLFAEGTSTDIAFAEARDIGSGVTALRYRRAEPKAE
ncbi:MAG TPA: dihydrofolate reductase family protein [Jatrophihabitantaceae bacterium]|jgi:dihydrofolate reductase